MASYKPLGGYSPSLQPSLDPADIADNDQLDLDGFQRTSTRSRPSSPRLEPDYTGYGYDGPSDDVERQGLVKEQEPAPRYQLYKRRWFGLAELTLLSFTIGWGYAAPSVVAETASEWYQITLPELNWLGIASNFVFLAPAPFVIYILNRQGPKFGILAACFFTVVGNWVMFAGARTHNFKVNIAGTVIHSLAAPFALCAPTRYSRQWFGDKGRTLATAIPSLAYPMGSGFGALTGPYMVKPVGPLNYDIQALIIACVFTAIAIPAIFIPKNPPSPPSEVAAARSLGFRESISSLLHNPQFYLQFFTFSVLAGAIDAAISVTYQALVPYGYTQQETADAIAILIFVGIGAAFIVSPILDYTKWHEKALKVFIVIVAIAYTAQPWVPESRSVAVLYVNYAIIGAASLSVEPCVLEFQAARTHPVSPEFSSVLCWSGAKVMAGVFTILVGETLISKKPEEGQPIGSLFNGMLLIAGMAWLSVACTMMNGHWIFKRTAASKVKGND